MSLLVLLISEFKIDSFSLIQNWNKSENILVYFIKDRILIIPSRIPDRKLWLSARFLWIRCLLHALNFNWGQSEWILGVKTRQIHLLLTCHSNRLDYLGLCWDGATTIGCSTRRTSLSLGTTSPRTFSFDFSCRFSPLGTFGKY